MSGYGQEIKQYLRDREELLVRRRTLIRRMRDEGGFTFGQIALLFGLSRSMVFRIYKGQRR